MASSSIEVKGLHDAVRLLREFEQDISNSDQSREARVAELQHYVEVLSQYDPNPMDTLEFAIDDADPKEPVHHIQVSWDDAGGLWKRCVGISTRIFLNRSVPEHGGQGLFDRSNR